MFVQIMAGFFLLGFCIFFHELGHYLMGKLVGVKVKIFSIGYGKGRLKKIVGDTTYQITAIPLGGYVQFYGDDITKKQDQIRPGDFFSVGPWKRILIAFGGPLFSVLLGLIVIFILLSFGWQPITNRIQIPNSSRSLPSSNILKNGDQIISVNGHPTNSFEEITYHVALTIDKNIQLKVKRGDQILKKTVTAESIPEGSPFRIGIRPEGVISLAVQSSKALNSEVKLLEGDKIVSANGIPISTISDLRKITDQNLDSKIQLGILREDTFLGRREEQKKIVVNAPVKAVEYFAFENIKYLNLNQTKELTEVGPWYGKHISLYQIEGESYTNWDDFKKAILYHIKNKASKRLKLIESKEPMEAAISLKTRGMLGIHLSELVKEKRANLPTDFLSLITRTYKQTIFATKSTLVGLYRIFQGRLSLRQSISGPIKIFDYARQSVSLGWDVYWFLLANITIILGIMNLLPIPVLDGGHILIYLIEGFYKPLPIGVISLSVKAGFITLLCFGLYVIFIDIWDVILKRFF